MKHYDNLIKPDLVAPGNKIISAEAKYNKLVTMHPELETNNYSTTNMKLMYMSGSSVSAPMVAGASALLLEANPNLTPNMVKMILMYTAQPLNGFNTFEQGAGQLNVAGAVSVAKLVRSDLLGALLGTAPAVGSSFLTQSAPSPQTTISTYAFPWAQGLVLNHTTITGSNLITKYQKSYGKGYLLGDGVTESTYSQSLSSSMWTSNLALGNYLMKSDGTPLGAGEFSVPPGSCLATAS